MHLLLLLISLGFYPGTPALAAQVESVVYSTTTAQGILEAYAAHYGIAAGPLVATLRCESDFNSRAVGDLGSSFGLAQIHLAAHPEITKQQALDPLWSIDYAAREFALGHAKEWTCYKNLKSVDSDLT